jgi:hypothetical protein
MPFHISYSGSAPVAQYFLVKESREGESAQRDGTGIAEGHRSNPDPEILTLSTEGSAAVNAESKVSDLDLGGPDVKDASKRVSSDPKSDIVENTDETTRYTAAFRGRIVKGLKHALPDGYTGLVLQVSTSNQNGSATTDTGGEKLSMQDKMRKMLRRSAKDKRGKKASTAIDVDEEPEYGDVVMDGENDDAERELADVGPQRVLKPIGKFEEFVCWRPDLEVDTSADEYLRSLKEWMKLSEAVSIFFRPCLFRISSSLPDVFL